eukprot:jgi/Mesvir1/17614/Mv08840-RA.1
MALRLWYNTDYRHVHDNIRPCAHAGGSGDAGPVLYQPKSRRNPPGGNNAARRNDTADHSSHWATDAPGGESRMDPPVSMKQSTSSKVKGRERSYKKDGVADTHDDSTDSTEMDMGYGQQGDADAEVSVREWRRGVRRQGRHAVGEGEDHPDLDPPHFVTRGMQGGEGRVGTGEPRKEEMGQQGRRPTRVNGPIKVLTWDKGADKASRESSVSRVEGRHGTAHDVGMTRGDSVNPALEPSATTDFTSTAPISRDVPGTPTAGSNNRVAPGTVQNHRPAGAADDRAGADDVAAPVTATWHPSAKHEAKAFVANLLADLQAKGRLPAGAVVDPLAPRTAASDAAVAERQAPAATAAAASNSRFPQPVAWAVANEEAVGDERQQQEMRRAVEAGSRLLASRACSAATLRQKLEEKGHPALATAQAIQRLQECGLQSDAEFAEMFARYKRRTAKWARSMVMRELRSKGVEDGVIRSALDACYGDDQAGGDEDGDAGTLDTHLMAAVERQWANTTGLDLEKRRRRVAGWLARRGHSWDVVGAILKQLK